MQKSRDLFVPSILLDKASGIPLHRQIHRQVAKAIRDGSIPDRARLPSSRVMAKLLRVSRNTVFAAWEELAADDLIRGERGAGMRVNGGGAAPEMSWFGLKQVIQAANYPARVLAFEDVDGSPLYLRCGAVHNPVK